MSWSPYKEMVIGYVQRNPGCSKLAVASYCTRNARRNPSKQYYIVNTAIRNGWIIAEYAGGRYYLFTDVEGRRMKMKALVCGHQIEIDRSGVDHCWVNAGNNDLPAQIREEIECEIIDGGRERCEDYVASNGLHYRW